MHFYNCVPAFATADTIDNGKEATTTKQVSEVLQTVEILMNVGRYQRAAFILKKTLNYDHDETIFLPLLICTYATGDLQVLVSTCQTWINANGSMSSKFDGIVWEFLGTAYSQQKEYKKAFDAFGKSIECDPRPRVIAARSKIDLQLGNQKLDIAGAEKGSMVERIDTLDQELNIALWQQSDAPLIETMLDSDTNSSDRVSTQTVEQIGKCEQLENSGQFGRAVELYAKTSKNKDFTSSMFNAYGLSLATAIQAKKTHPDALKEVEVLLDKAILINRSDWRLWSNLAVIRFGRGNTQGAFEAFKKAIEFKEIPVAQRLALGRRIRMDWTMELLKKRYQDNH